MSREINLNEKLSEEDRDYLLARGREQQVFRNDARFADQPSAEALAMASYVPGTGIDRAEGVPATPGGDPRVVMGGGEVGEPDEDDEDDEGPRAASEVVDNPLAGGGDNYETWTKKQLRQEIESRNEERAEDDQLPVGGDKADLVARLRQDDEESGE